MNGRAIQTGDLTPTNSANTENWLIASKGMVISAYAETRTQLIMRGGMAVGGGSSESKLAVDLPLIPPESNGGSQESFDLAVPGK